MNECMKVITSRRTIRQYKKDQITDSDLQQILDCAIQAPNARNEQSWHFTVVQNKEMLHRLVDIAKENIMNSGNAFLIERASAPDYHTFYNAPTVIILTGDEKAKSLNLGSCIMTSSGFSFASEKSNEIKKELGIPEGYDHVCAVALGYRDGEDPVAPQRNKNVINRIS